VKYESQDEDNANATDFHKHIWITQKLNPNTTSTSSDVTKIESVWIVSHVELGNW